MGLFGPAWKSKNVSKAIAAVQKITDENELLDVVKTCPTEAWKTALNQIKSPSILVRTAIESPSAVVRLAAVRKITDIPSLEIIAQKESGFDNRKAIWEWVTECRVQEVKSMTDQNKLKQLALTSNYASVPETAAQMLVHTEDLLDIAINSRSYSARVAALEKLADNQNALYEVVLKGDSSIGGDALKMITDSELLDKIALNCPNDNNRSGAVRRISNQEVLGKVALEDKVTNIRRFAVDRITDQEILANVALNNDRCEIIGDAFRRIQDTKVLEQLIQNHPYLLRDNWMIWGKIQNQFMLYDIAVNEQLDIDIRTSAVKAMQDLNLVKKLTEESIVYEVRKQAKGRMSVLGNKLGQCTSCGKKLSADELAQCRCYSCGNVNHDFETREENVKSATEKDSYWSRDIYRVCRRCGKREYVTTYEGWGSDVD